MIVILEGMENTMLRFEREAGVCERPPPVEAAIFWRGKNVADVWSKCNFEYLRSARSFNEMRHQGNFQLHLQ